MDLVGRAVELARIDDLLASGLSGRGELLVVVGSPGSGKSALLSEAARTARRRGLAVAGGSTIGSSGRTVWARLLHEVGGPSELVEALTGNADAVALDAAARALAGVEQHLLVIDDIDHGGPEALEVLSMLAAHLVVGSTVVLVASVRALGVGVEIRLAGLSEGELDGVLRDVPAEVRHAVWRASGGMPGVARALVGRLAELPAGDDSLVHLALHARSTARFLEVDPAVVLLLEAALEHAAGDVDRARLSARLARELLGDATAGALRRSLVEEAMRLARRSGDRQALAEALDARLHALWDPSAAQDRLDAAAEIVDLARTAGDPVRERSGLFWRFVALMELARVAEAESALNAFARLARRAGDDEAMVMVSARQAMLATMRGRFAEAARLVDEVAAAGRRAGVSDTAALVGTLRGAAIILREDDDEEAAVGVESLTTAARWQPGHLFEASAARVLAMLGRRKEAAAELKRTLPQVLPGSGPRWLGAAADLCVVAAVTADEDAARLLYDALLPYRGRLVIWGGANTVTGPAAYYLGLLAALLRHHDDAVDLLSEAAETGEQIGALPWLAHILTALADALARRGGPDDFAHAASCRERARVLARQLDLAGLLRRLVPPPEEWTLRREPDGDWLLRAGEEQARLRDSRGMHQLRVLLSAPRTEVSALDLVAGGAGLSASRAVPILDRTAVENYRRRLAELESDLDAADLAGDAGKALRVETERDALLDELRRASGLGGRVRHASDEAERARINVTRTLRTAVERVSEVAPRAGAHLSASIRTGSACRYDPAERGPTRWHV